MFIQRIQNGWSRRFSSLILPPHERFCIPDALSLDNGYQLSRWLVQEGELIAPHSVLCEITNRHGIFPLKHNGAKFPLSLVKRLVEPSHPLLKHGDVIGVLAYDPSLSTCFLEVSFADMNSHSTAVPSVDLSPQVMSKLVSLLLNTKETPLMTNVELLSKIRKEFANLESSGVRDLLRILLVLNHHEAKAWFPEEIDLVCGLLESKDRVQFSDSDLVETVALYSKMKRFDASRFVLECLKEFEMRLGSSDKKNGGAFKKLRLGLLLFNYSPTSVLYQRVFSASM